MIADSRELAKSLDGKDGVSPYVICNERRCVAGCCTLRYNFAIPHIEVISMNKGDMVGVYIKKLIVIPTTNLR